MQGAHTGPPRDGNNTRVVRIRLRIFTSPAIGPSAATGLAGGDAQLVGVNLNSSPPVTGPYPAAARFSLGVRNVALTMRVIANRPKAYAECWLMRPIRVLSSTWTSS